MKKILTLLMMLVLVTTTVLAQGFGRPDFEESHPSARGLENAILRVRNEESKAHLEEVMNRIQERHRERLSQLDDLTFEEQEDGSLEAEGIGRGKFLGLIKLGYKYQYRVHENGQLVRVQKPFDFLFTDLDEQLNGVE